MSKNIIFSISKYYFINFNTPLYNTPYIKSFIFFTTSLKYYLFIIYNSFFFLHETSLSLFLCVSLFSKQKQPTYPSWPLPTTTHSMSPPATNPQPTTESINPPPPKRDREPTTSTPSNPRPQHIAQPTTNHRINPDPQINSTPTNQSTPWNQPSIYKSTHTHNQQTPINPTTPKMPHVQRGTGSGSYV